MIYWILLPVVFAILHQKTKKYPFSPAVTLTCGVLCLSGGCPVLTLGLVCSAAGDFLLHHERGRAAFFLGGVGGFSLGHLCFLLHCILRGGWHPVSLLSGGVLFGTIALFLLRPIWDGIPGKLRWAVLLYGGISCFSLVFSLFSGFPAPSGALFTLGIGLILFSDSLIALSRFGHRKCLGKWIMPTYFACHICLTLSVLS